MMWSSAACRRARPPPASDDGTTVTIRVGTPLEEVERRVTLATLAQCGHVKRKAADILGVSLKTLYNRLEVYNGRNGAEPEVGEAPSRAGLTGSRANGSPKRIAGASANRPRITRITSAVSSHFAVGVREQTAGNFRRSDHPGQRPALLPFANVAASVVRWIAASISSTCSRCAMTTDARSGTRRQCLSHGRPRSKASSACASWRSCSARRLKRRSRTDTRLQHLPAHQAGEGEQHAQHAQYPQSDLARKHHGHPQHQRGAREPRRDDAQRRQPQLAAQRVHLLLDRQADHLQPRLAHGQQLPQQRSAALGE